MARCRSEAEDGGGGLALEKLELGSDRGQGRRMEMGGPVVPPKGVGDQRSLQLFLGSPPQPFWVC